VSDRGWVGRPSGARTGSATQPLSSRVEPGADSPARSGNPERIPVPRPGPRARAPVPEPKGPALRVVLVSRDNLLAGALRSLIEAPGGVRVLDWHSEGLDAAIRHADVVIVDMPPNLHERAFAVIGGRFLGRTVVLLQEGEHAAALPPGPTRAVLYRPVQIGELWTAVTGSTPPVAAEPEPPGAEVGPAAGPEEPQADVEPEAPGPEPEAAADPSAGEETVGETTAAAVEGTGLPVAESGRLIGPSGQELDPVIGPGQLAPGLDPATLERLRGWGDRGRQSARGTGQAPAGHRSTAAREETRQAKAERAEVRGAGAARVGVGEVVGAAVVVVAMAAVGLGVAGWRGGGGPDTLAGEVAVVRAAGGSGGGLVAQDPRVGPIEPLHALAVGAWLRATGAGSPLEGAIREARVPSRFLLAGVVVLTVLLCLLLMRAGPGTGAAAGPGPAPPQLQERDGRGRRWRLGAAALAGALAALDPVLVRNGRAATGTVLAVALALGALAVAWGLPARPTLRWLPLVAAVGGLALLVSPLALPVLAVPVVAEFLQGRHRQAWRDLAALGLGIGLWLALPIWVAGQGLDAGWAGWLLGRPSGRGAIAAAVADAPLTWLLVAAGLAATMPPWRPRSGARAAAGGGAARLLAWTATTAAGALVAIVLGYPAEQALPFAVPAAAVSLAVAATRAVAGAWARGPVRRAVPRFVGAGVGVALAALLVAQWVDWDARYRPSADDGLDRLVASVHKLPDCSVVNAGGPDDRARLLAAGATVTGFSNGLAAQAAGVRYFVLTGAAQGGPTTPSLATWVRQHGTRVAAHPSRTLSGLGLWRVDAAPLDPVADHLPVPDGVFSNVRGSACGGYRVVDSQAGAFYTAYRAVGGKAVLGRPLGTVWTSDGPALQAFDTMVLGAAPATDGPPAVAPIELPPLLAKLDVKAVADADIPLPSARPPVTDRQTLALLKDKAIAREYLDTDPAAASAADRRRARARFGRPLGLPQVMPDGAVRQTFERVVLELPADGGPARPAALGRLAVRLGLVPKQAMRPESVPGLPAPAAETRLDTGPLLRLVGGGLLLLALAAGAGVAIAWPTRPARPG
jgi:hypothetical protein